MNATTTTTNETTTTTTNNESPKTIPEALVDVAVAWAEVGLTHAKTSLFGSARALERTGNALDVIRERLRA